MILSRPRSPVVCCLVLWLASGPVASAADVALVRDGAPACIVVVPPGTLADDGDEKAYRQRAPWEQMPEMERRLLRDSARDLARCLGRMGACEIEVVEDLPAGERRLPILVGAVAEPVFGPVGISKAGRYGFRVVADPGKGVGLYGESEHGASYAVYEFLHRLGCRWFMPSELGEVIPEGKSVIVPTLDEKRAPATERRSMTARTGDADWFRRNRFTAWSGGGKTTCYGRTVEVGGPQGSLEGLVSAQQREEHPEWKLVVDGTPHPHLLRWTRPDVAAAMADAIVAKIEGEFAPARAAGYQLSFGIVPGDYVLPTEDPEERKADPEPRVWEKAAGRWSVTDRYVLLANRIAERVAMKHPDVTIALLGYVNCIMPSARHVPRPDLVMTLAPIDFHRHQPMTDADHPLGSALLDLVTGWGGQPSRLGYYAYGMNLAELTAPCPFITKWGTDIPILMANGLVAWTPETMNGWETMMPGYYLATRLTFDPTEKPAEILDDIWQRFYGAAAGPMGRYWRHVDRAWSESKCYAGSGFGYLKVFTPEVMQEARRLVHEATAACRIPLEYRRVRLVDDSLTLFERFMKMREDYAAGKLRMLDRDLAQWKSSLVHLRAAYEPQKAFGPAGLHPDGIAMAYINGQFAPAYEDGARMDREFVRLGTPLLEWKWRHNSGPEADATAWTAADFDDRDWRTTHVVRDTWADLGHYFSMTDEPSGRSGRMAYRATAKLPAVPPGKRAYLWIGSTDGRATLFVNGRHVKYVVPEKTGQHEAGTALDAFDGSCRPALFDVTDALTAGDNRLSILCERYFLNELGTGGLMGPVVLYRDR